MIPIPFLIFFLTIVAICLYKIGTKTFRFFESRGIKAVKPIPFIGTNTWLFTRGSFMEYLQKPYNRYHDEKAFGLFDFQRPILVLRDPELIKKITIKDFDHFTDHRGLFPLKANDILSNTLGMLRGQRWHEMRISLSPTFTSSKMRMMFELISACGQQMVEFLHKDFEKNGGLQSYDMKDLYNRSTSDVIASCAFGLKTDSLNEPDNQFHREIVNEMTKIRKPAIMLKVMMLRMLPNLSQILKIDIFSKGVQKLFNEIIIETMKSREKEQIYRPDMIHLLMELKKGGLKVENENDEDNNEELPASSTSTKKSWTDNEIIAQCFVFFVAGFDPVASALVYASYELAMNPDVQSRLREEIEEAKEKLQGKPITYEIIKELKYMDMVVSETLRKWPPAPLTDRVCTKDYSYQDDSGLKFELSPGDILWLPIYAIHRDPKYYPDPEKFDPERFNDDNKYRINSRPYLPFGSGPRICIGSRFALIEVKTILFYVLSEFSMEVCEKTVISLKPKKGIIGLAPEKEVYLNLKPLK